MRTNKAQQESVEQNKLWQARERAGFERKRVALLAGKTADEISRYERGLNQPNLKTALKLEIIYRLPVKLLFPELFRKLENEIAATGKQYSFPDNEWFPASVEKLSAEEFCFYGSLLQNRIPNELELRTIKRHVTDLINTARDFPAKPRSKN